MQHLFLDSELARFLWVYFGARMGISADYSSMRGMFSEWQSKAPLSSNVGFIASLIPVLVCWSIWRYRNLVLHEALHLGKDGEHYI